MKVVKSAFLKGDEDMKYVSLHHSTPISPLSEFVSETNNSRNSNSGKLSESIDVKHLGARGFWFEIQSRFECKNIKTKYEYI